ncbi:MAG TPA: hypothetical protein VNA32_01465, partial [Actinomycetota bacterium]|nr:hypothetical protein [Actinomycetota bacterium]
LNFDVVGDAEAVPDLAVFAEGMSHALEELGAASPEPALYPPDGAPGDTQVTEPPVRHARR